MERLIADQPFEQQGERRGIVRWKEPRPVTAQQPRVAWDLAGQQRGPGGDGLANHIGAALAGGRQQADVALAQQAYGAGVAQRADPSAAWRLGLPHRGG